MGNQLADLKDNITLRICSGVHGFYHKPLIKKLATGPEVKPLGNVAIVASLGGTMVSLLLVPTPLAPMGWAGLLVASQTGLLAIHALDVKECLKSGRASLARDLFEKIGLGDHLPGVVSDLYISALDPNASLPDELSAADNMTCRAYKG